MRTTFNDGETKRLLKEMMAVNYSLISEKRTSRQKIATQNKVVRDYAKRLNGWVHSKIKHNYKAKIVKIKQP